MRCCRFIPHYSYFPPILPLTSRNKTDSEIGRDTVVTLKCNLTKVPETHRSEFTNKEVGKFYKFWVKVEIHVTEKCEVKITSGGKVLASAEVPLGESDISV